MNQYKGWTLGELIEEAGKDDLTPREFRALHREMQKYNFGIPFELRYPTLPIWLLALAIAVTWFCCR